MNGIDYFEGDDLLLKVTYHHARGLFLYGM